MPKRTNVPGKEKEIQYTGTLSSEIFEKLKEHAKHNERSINCAIKIILRDYFQNKANSV